MRKSKKSKLKKIKENEKKPEKIKIKPKVRNIANVVTEEYTAVEDQLEKSPDH